MKMREAIKGLKATVDAIAKDKVLGVKRGAAVPSDAGGKCVSLVGARGIAPRRPTLWSCASPSRRKPCEWLRSA